MSDVWLFCRRRVGWLPQKQLLNMLSVTAEQRTLDLTELPLTQSPGSVCLPFADSSRLIDVRHKILITKWSLTAHSEQEPVSGVSTYCIWTEIRKKLCRPLKLVICTFWKWVNECWLMGKLFSSLKNPNVIIWFMSGWRKTAAAERSHHLRGLQPGVWETDELPLCAQPSITSLQHQPRRNTQRLHVKDSCLFLYPIISEETVKLDGKQTIIPRFQWNKSKLYSEHHS